jgi:hypothetical protein
MSKNLLEKDIGLTELTDQLCLLHFEELGYIFCSNAGRSFVFLVHHFS